MPTPVTTSTPSTPRLPFAHSIPHTRPKIHFLEPWPGTLIHRLMQRTLELPDLNIEEWAEVDYYFAHHPGLHDDSWESRICSANQELSPYVEA